MSLSQLTALYNISSFLLGITAWILAGIAIARKKRQLSNYYSLTSFGMCILSLLLQIFEVANRVNQNDYAAIADTIHAVCFAACVLVGVTLVLNLMAVVKAKNKQ